MQKLFLIILNLVFLPICLAEVSNQTTTPTTQQTTKRKRKLWFLFPHKSARTDADFYCPRKHVVTRVEDLCYYFHRHKKSNSQASEACGNSSHRLVHVDSELTWSALVYAAEKFVRRVTANTNVNLKSTTAFRFHVGRVNLLDDNNQVELILDV